MVMITVVKPLTSFGLPKLNSLIGKIKLQDGSVIGIIPLNNMMILTMKVRLGVYKFMKLSSKNGENMMLFTLSNQSMNLNLIQSPKN
jgi:hypothetical protein